MAYMNKYTGDKEALYDFCVDTDLIDTVALVNPGVEKDLTYIYGRKRIDYIFTSPALAAVAIKGGDHQFHQHIISDHKEYICISM